MARLSVVIPSRNPQYLARTIEDCFVKAAGDVEVIVAFDGYSPSRLGFNHEDLHCVFLPKPEGMRQAINAAAKVATGQYLMKIDEHVMLGEGYDEILKADCEPDWIAVPRRYALDPERWDLDASQRATDAHYLSWPWLKTPPSFRGMKWPERTVARWGIEIDDEMSSQGSCWFMHKNYFKPLDWKNYGGFAQEFQELSLKCWLGGGRVVCNKRTWYAHWHKPHVPGGRGYHLSTREQHKGWNFSFDYWWNNRWPERIHDLDWLIDKFWPVPGWPDNWRGEYELGRGNVSRQEGRAGYAQVLEQSQ